VAAFTATATTEALHSSSTLRGVPSLPVSSTLQTVGICWRRQCVKGPADHLATSRILTTLSVQDVLVATDVASKGLDFPEIQHVINYDMPDEIENYVHRIGRTGRCGKTGIATTFINKNQVCSGAVSSALQQFDRAITVQPWLETALSAAWQLGPAKSGFC